jgi:DNA-binding LytR/AlgR family response regulator
MLQHIVLNLGVGCPILKFGHIHIFQRELNPNLFRVDLTLGKQYNRLDQIYYLESDLRQINVYGDIPHQPICTFYGKIADLPAMLYENGFLQVGRSDVVNLQYVRSIRNYKVELRSGVELNASRQDFPAIRSAWLEWKGQFGNE